MKFLVLWSVLCNRAHIDISCINEMVTLYKCIVDSFIQSDSIVAICDGLNKYTGHTLQGSVVSLFLRFILLALAIFLQKIYPWRLIRRLP